MKRSKISFPICLLLPALTALCAGTAWADLSITISEGAGGTATVELVGSGTLTTVDGSAEFFNFVTGTDTFIVDGTASISDDAVSPGLTIGSYSTSRMFLADSGGFDSGNGILASSRFGIGAASTPSMADGDSLSDLNGVYTTTLPFSVFVPGTYFPDMGFPNAGSSVADVGTVTLTVIPEPGSAALLGLAGLALVRRRR